MSYECEYLKNEKICKNKEIFKEKETNKIRENEREYYMEEVEKMCYLSEKNGFRVLKMYNENDYYVLQKI